MVSCFVFNRSFQTLNGSVFLFIITQHQVKSITPVSPALITPRPSLSNDPGKL